jgi:hypothetical protein
VAQQALTVQVGEAEIRHGAGDRADIGAVAGFDEDDVETLG